MFGPQKEINRKNEVGGGEEHWSFKSHGSHLGRVRPSLQQSRRGKNNGCLPLCLQVCIRWRNYLSEHRSPKVKGLFLTILAPTSCCKLLLKQGYSYFRVTGAEGGRGECTGTGSSYCAKIWKLTIIYLPSLPLKLASLQQTQEFQISYRFRQYNCCLGRQLWFLMLLIMPSSQDPPSIIF